MDKKELARKRRKKRLMKKRLYSLVVSLLIVLIGVFLVRGIVLMVTGKNTPPAGQLPSSSIEQEQPNSTQELSPTPQPSPTPVKPAKNEFTTLVNINNPLQDNFDVTTRKIKNTEKLFDVRAADQLEAMLSDAANAGYPMFLVSTYRTIAYQKGLYNRKVQSYLNAGYSQEAAQAEAAKWVAIPGTSEHNLGLAADIVSSTWYNSNNDLTQEFENTPHFTWLIENCHKYGFVIRYPKGKEAVTMIQYEPWHYRYVGVEVATYLMENNLTLEEFWEE